MYSPIRNLNLIQETPLFGEEGDGQQKNNDDMAQDLENQLLINNRLKHMIFQLTSTVKNEIDNKLNGSIFMDKMP